MLKRLHIVFLSILLSSVLSASDGSKKLYISTILAQAWKQTIGLFFQDYEFDRAYKAAQQKLEREIPSAIQTYKILNANSENPFALTIGLSMSQITQTNNTINPEFLSEQLHKIAQQQKDPEKWLDARKGYLHAYPRFQWTQQHWQAMVDQLECLKLFDQSGVQSGLPTNRISLEIADFLQDGSTDIDSVKLQSLVANVRKMKNPLLCMHHYTNPLSNPHMFEQNTDIALFATYCSEFMKVYVGSMTEQERAEKEICICPMSQPVAFGLRVAYQQNLPPFMCNIDRAQFLQNIADANIMAAWQIKKQNPNAKVLFSHQFKPFKQVHGKIHPKYALESLVCYIADKMYNGQFINMFKNHQDCFDGIALSVYPSGHFDGTNYTQDNCSGQLDPQGFLEAIVMAHKAFETKDIYIVETGCNTFNQDTKKKFIDMMLYVCQLAREMGISVKMCSLWGQMDEPYYEWEHVGRSYFGYFDSLDISNPCASINDGGRYIQEILK